MTGLGAEHFDHWYADMASSRALENAQQRLLGLPPDLQSTSLLTLDGLREVADALALEPGQTLLDLACGRGGYGLWLAREHGVRVIGVDFSAVALDAARRSAAGFGLDGRAEFALGDLEATGLPAACVDAVLCIDAVQFAGSTEAAATEIRRVLRPGGRAALTCWEPLDPSDASLPERIRLLDLAGSLAAGGLVDVTSRDRAGWLGAERAYWEAAVECDPAGDPALVSWQEEGQRVLPTLDRLRRVMVTGRAPL